MASEERSVNSMTPDSGDSNVDDRAIVPETPGRYSTTSGGDTDAVDPTPAPITPSAPSTPTRSPRHIDLPRGTLNEVHDARTPMTDDDGTSTGGTSNRPKRVIWGTDVNVDECFDKLTEFLKNYKPGEGYSDTAAYYSRLLDKAHDVEESVINVDLQHLLEHEPALYTMLVNYPTEIIGIFDLAIQSFYREKFDEDKPMEVRTFNLREKEMYSLRELDPTLINQVIGIRGMVVRCSQVVPDLYRGFYRCIRCGHTEAVDVDRGLLVEPVVCVNCDSRSSFEMIHNRGMFNDKQMIKIQEAPESIPQGETPSTVTVIAYESLVDSVKPGDRVDITGIFRAVPMRISQRQRTVRNVFRTYLDLIHVKVMMPKAEGDVLEDATSRDERMAEVARSENIYERLAASIAPSIYGMDDVKKGVLLQLFGGSQKDFSDKGWGRIRSEINVLLVGDPGTSKSQILRYVHRLAPRGIYTSGSGSSAVGLTAYVARDADSGELVLESGALVLSDQGICCVDEFDKMSDYTRSILHEAMEQQTISVAKAGIIATLNARTSLLAAANPVDSRYDPKKTVVDNIQLPPTLLSRFDLIFLILDQVDIESDKRLAKHIVSLFYDSINNASGNETSYTGTGIGGQKLVEYIAYAREKVKPRLSDAASDKLLELYVAMRKRGGEGAGGVRTVSATPRNLESLVRMSEARAKLELREVVEVSDVDEAHRLMVSAIAQVATDPTTGLLDIDLLNAGQSAHQRGKARDLANILWTTLSNWESGGDVRLNMLLQKTNEDASVRIKETEMKKALKLLEDEEKIVFTSSRLAIRRLA